MPTAIPKPENASRAAIISYRLTLMREYFEQLSRLNWDSKSAALEDKYLRVLGESCRAVSLNDRSPLCGYGKAGGKHIKTVIRHFDDLHRKPLELSKADHLKKKERRLQSWLIKQALLNDRSLVKNGPLANCLGGHIDEMIFAFDEISFGDKNHIAEQDGRPQIVRCDLVAVGFKGQEVFPVVIELKSNRSLGRLDEQLKNAERELLESFSQMGPLLQLVCGRPINSKIVRKILIWPHGKESNKTRLQRENLAKGQNVFFVEYAPKDFNAPEDIRFVPLS